MNASCEPSGRRSVRQQGWKRMGRRPCLYVALTVLTVALAACAVQPAPPVPLGVSPEVKIEEIAYRYTPANNGADPLWAYGSTVIARWQDDTLISGLETVPGAAPYNNVRCQVYRRGDDGWSLAWDGDDHLTREPCPAGVFQDGRLILSANPTLGDGPEPDGGPAQPTLLEFPIGDPTAPPEASLPVWRTDSPFNQHSYRGLAVDCAGQEALLLNINGYIGHDWAFRDAEGGWSAQGRLGFPYDLATRQINRLCYPQVALANRQAYVMAISDIEEPVDEYRRHKMEQGKNAFLYVFRRLYYTWTPDITTVSFSPWIELANREETAGSVHNEDIWMGADGAAHLLWIESPVEPQLRDRFFPDVALGVDLVHAVVREGEVVSREVLVHWQEGEPGERVQWARFHATCDGRLYVVYADYQMPTPGRLENRLLRLLPEGGASASALIPLEHPLARFVLAAERAGSVCSDGIDIVGSFEEGTIRYARVSLATEGSQ